MAIQDKHIQSKTASTTPNKNKIPNGAATINDMAKSADREQLSNLDMNSPTPGSQPSWETSPSGSSLSTPSAASAGYHGGDKGERHDGRAADINGRTGEDRSQRTDRLPERGDQKIQLNTGGSSSGGSSSDSSLREKASNAADEIRDKAGELKNKAGELMGNSNSSSNSGSTSGGMKDKAEDLKHRASSAAHDVQNSASRAGQAVHEQYRTGARKAKQQASQMRSRISDTIDQNPLALVAIGVGIGAALGLLLPSTRREDRIMGEQRDRLKEQLMSASAQQVSKARQQLEEAH